MGNKLSTNLYYDLNAIKEFVFEEEARNNDVEVTETLAMNDEHKLETLNKVIREVKTSDFSNKQTIRYDILKSFIDSLSDVDIDIDEVPMTFGQHTILNTLTTFGIIKRQNEN